MKYKLENLLIWVIIGLFALKWMNDSTVIDDIMRVFVRNIHLLLLLYVIFIYFNDMIAYVSEKIKHFVIPRWRRFKRRLTGLFRR